MKFVQCILVAVEINNHDVVTETAAELFAGQVLSDDEL